MTNVKRNHRGMLSQVIMGTVLILIAFSCLFPMYLVLVNSFATEESILKNGYQVIPEAFSVEAYQSIFYAGSPTLKSYSYLCDRKIKYSTQDGNGHRGDSILSAERISHFREYWD